MNEGVLSEIGNTPLVRLSRIFPGLPFNLYAKLEGHNPGGSMKDRPALSIIRQAIEMGRITPETVIIESSSGNMGVGLAQTCAYYNLRLICVVDPKTNFQNIELMRAYGAEIDMTEKPTRRRRSSSRRGSPASKRYSGNTRTASGPTSTPTCTTRSPTTGRWRRSSML